VRNRGFGRARCGPGAAAAASDVCGQKTLAAALAAVAAHKPPHRSLCRVSLLARPHAMATVEDQEWDEECEARFESQLLPLHLLTGAPSLRCVDLRYHRSHEWTKWHCPVREFWLEQAAGAGRSVAVGGGGNERSRGSGGSGGAVQTARGAALRRKPYRAQRPPQQQHRPPSVRSAPLRGEAARATGCTCSG
jgi:hypothetical protein